MKCVCNEILTLIMQYEIAELNDASKKQIGALLANLRLCCENCNECNENDNKKNICESIEFTTTMRLIDKINKVEGI